MRTIFITGGATGIGAASVRKFIREGWSVGFMDVNRQEAMKLTEELGSPETLLYVPGNVCDREDIRHAVDLTIERFGSLTSVFANAGIHRRNTLLDISDEELRLVIDTNIYGTVNTLREAIPHIIEAGGGSVVINCSDQWFVGKAHSFAYGLTKGALGQITQPFGRPGSGGRKSKCHLSWHNSYSSCRQPLRKIFPQRQPPCRGTLERREFPLCPRKCRHSR